MVELVSSMSDPLASPKGACKGPVLVEVEEDPYMCNEGPWGEGGA